MAREKRRNYLNAPDPNIQQPTSNTQHPMMAIGSALGCSMLVVGCWMQSASAGTRGFLSPSDGKRVPEGQVKGLCANLLIVVGKSYYRLARPPPGKSGADGGRERTPKSRPGCSTGRGTRLPARTCRMKPWKAVSAVSR